MVYFGNFVSLHQTHHSPIVPNRCIALRCQFLEPLTTSIASNCTFNVKLLNHHSEFDPIRHQPLIYVHVPIAQLTDFNHDLQVDVHSRLPYRSFKYHHYM